MRSGIFGEVERELVRFLDTVKEHPKQLKLLKTDLLQYSKTVRDPNIIPNASEHDEHGEPLLAAEVTGVPINFLLTRGQMVKVMSMIYRNCRAE